MRCLVCLQVLAFSLVLQEVTSKPFSQSSASSHGEAFEWHARKVGDKRVAIVSIKKDPNRDRRSVYNDSSGRTSRHHHGHHRFSQAPEELHRRGVSGRGRSEEWRHGGRGEEPTRNLHHRRTESPSSPPPYDHPESGLHGHHYQSRHDRRRTRHHEDFEDEDRSRISLRQSHHKDHSTSDNRPASLRHHNGRDRNRSPLTLISTRSPDTRSDLFEDEEDEEEEEEQEEDMEEDEEDLAALDLKQKPKRHRSHLTHTSHTTEDLVRRYGRDQVSYRNETRPSRAAKRRMKKKNGKGSSKKGEKRNKRRRDKKKRREKKRKRNKKRKGRRNKSRGRQGRRKKKDPTPPPPTSDSGVDIPGATDTELTGSDACQYKNMLTCGQNTSILEHTDNISDVDSQLVRKCIARQEFFTCMEKEREKPCSANQRARGDMSRLRGRIRDAIWTSGNCIVNQMVKEGTGQN